MKKEYDFSKEKRNPYISDVKNRPFSFLWLIYIARGYAMSLQSSLQETIKEFEKTVSPSQLKELEAVNNLFDAMVLKGLIAPPSYDLEPIGTIMTNISLSTKL